MAKDGRELNIHGSVRLLRDNGGEIAGAVGSFMDVTSLVLANEKIALFEEQVGLRHVFEELIGHVKGSFTGAASDKIGMFEAAHHGTLFRDEIGDVSPAIQVKLLRVLQEREQIISALRQTGGNRTKAAEILGTSRVTLWKKIGKYAIEIPG